MQFFSLQVCTSHKNTICYNNERTSLKWHWLGFCGQKVTTYITLYANLISTKVSTSHQNSTCKHDDFTLIQVCTEVLCVLKYIFVWIDIHVLTPLFRLVPNSSLFSTDVNPYRNQLTLQWNVWDFFVRNKLWPNFESFSFAFLNDTTRKENLKGMWNAFLISAASWKIIFTIDAGLLWLFNHAKMLLHHSQSL